MLRELVKRWSNHKVMVRWLSRFFHYLDRYFIARRSLPALHEVGLTCFRDLVFILVSNWCIVIFVSLVSFNLKIGLTFCIMILLFWFQVYLELNGKVRDAVISLVCQRLRAITSTVLLFVFLTQRLTNGIF